MKKYARLRSSSLSEQFEPYIHGNSERRPDTIWVSPNDDSTKWNASPSRVMSSGEREHAPRPLSSSHISLAEALKKLTSLRDNRRGESPPPKSASARWGEGPRGSDFGNRPWPLSGIGKQLEQVTATNGCRDELDLPHAGKRMPEEEWSVISIEHAHTQVNHRRSSSVHDIGQPAKFTTMPGIQRPSKLSLSCDFEEAAQWPAPVRTAPPRHRRQPSSGVFPPLEESCLWDDDSQGINNRATLTMTKNAPAVQSLRYDRLDPDFTKDSSTREPNRGPLQSQSVREGVGHAQAIAAMAKAYAEKYGVPQAIVECVSCGRSLGVIVEGGSPGSYDSSFCQSCRPAASDGWMHATSKATQKSSKSKGKGMMNYCRKLLLRMGKKPKHKYTMV